MPVIRRFVREHLRDHLPSIALGSLLMVLAGLCQGLTVTSLKFVFEDNLGLPPPSGADNLAVAVAAKQWLISLLPPGSLLTRASLLVPALIVILLVAKGGFIYAGTLLVVKSGILATQELRERLFRHFLSLEPAFFQRHPVGELLQRSISDVAAVQGIASRQLADAVREVAIALVMLGVVLWMDWRLSLFLLVSFPLAIGPLRQMSRRIRRVNHASMEATAGLLQRLKEVFANIRVVHGFAAEGYELERFRRQQHELYRLGMKSARAAAMSHPIMEVLAGVLLGALILYATQAIEHGTMSGPNFVTYLMAVFALYDPTRRLTRLNNELQVARASLDRVFAMLDRPSGLAVPTAPQPVPAVPERLRFEGVSFAYDPTQPVLSDIDLELRRGETVALVGSSGAGKSTLMNLVPRFFDPTAGRVTLDGVDLRAFDPRQLRRRIGVVTQDTLLFLDSVHDNIAYGRPASRAEVEAAAQKAHAHDFVVALPQGYDTPLAEAGTSLSGGQRQRLAIARALLQNPPILLLDEATSALDSASERAVQEALDALMEDRTTLVVAHRLSTVQRASRICVLAAGRITEQGRHDELLALGGDYARMHALQLER